MVPTQEIENLNLDFKNLQKAGFMLGHASVVSIPSNFNMIDYIHHLFEFSTKDRAVNVF